ncbi:MAG: hypothetical protein FWE41_07215 [Coriobacteriia bacterium]|nr:hypothetical protein [Coriobacteriia bacterium]MCL2750778.1 hypothetical protein [Coriobacteriia bacterium]
MATRVTSKNKAMRVSRFIKGLIALSLALFCLMYLMPATVAAAAGPAELRLTIQQSFTASGTATPPSETFSYRLAPEVSSNPTPAGNGIDYTFTIRGTDEVDVGPLYFYQEGVYRYELRHITATASGYVFDAEVYKVEIHVASDMKVVVVAIKSNGKKADVLAFSHSFSGTAPKPDDKPGPVPTPPPSVVIVPGPTPAPITVIVPNPVIPPLPVVVPDSGNQQPATQTEEPTVSIIDPVMEALEAPGVLSINLFGLEVPLFGGLGYWGLANLVLCLAAGVLTFTIWFRAFLAERAKSKAAAARYKRSPEDSESGLLTGDQDKPQLHQRLSLGWLATAVTATAVGIFLFVFTVDLSKSMALADAWTICYAVLFMLVIAALVCARKQGAPKGSAKGKQPA